MPPAPPARDAPLDIVIMVTPSFNALATMGFVDPFRAANYLEGERLFRWHLVSEAGGACRASNGIALGTAALADHARARPGLAVISSSWTPEAHATPALRAALRGWARRGVPVAGLDTGAVILAQCGLLEGRRATVHYEHIDAFRETAPGVAVVEDLYTADGPRFTAGAGAASVDLALHILGALHGPALASAAARYLLHPAIRPPGTRQHSAAPERFALPVPDAVRQVIDLMESHLEEPLAIPDLCRRAGQSQRQVDRLFARHVGRTPALYYRDIRLDRARGLVTQTGMSVGEIAAACGFASAVHFSRAYKERFGLPPARDRVEGRVPFEFRAWPIYRKPRATAAGHGEKS